MVKQNKPKVNWNNFFAGVFVVCIFLFFIFLFSRAMYFIGFNPTTDYYCKQIYGNQSRMEHNQDFGYSCVIPIKENRTLEYNYFEVEEFYEFAKTCNPPRFLDILKCDRREC